MELSAESAPVLVRIEPTADMNELLVLGLPYPFIRTALRKFSSVRAKFVSQAKKTALIWKDRF
ncbi:hypothetical protein AA11237_1008 [Acidocella aminolytica 101 = DSM 11237]|nr:hypothetical protein AA11237_1008 [Acidocella aminolytica 101 = DSM 11237]